MADTEISVDLERKEESAIVDSTTEEGMMKAEDVIVEDVEEDEVEENTQRGNDDVSSKEATPDLSSFQKIMNDFLHDLQTTFPEHKDVLSAHFDEDGSLKTQELYDYCKNVYPERFFDFLYKNEKIVDDETINTKILPQLDLKDLWSVDGITDSMKETIWKYLQLALFSIVGDVEDKNIFGQTTRLFESIDENALKDKMKDTMKDLFTLFQNAEDNNSCNDGSDEEPSDAPEFLNPENMQEHISSLLGGKLGQLATEIAEETAKELELDLENTENSEETMKKLFSNPAKLMELVKKVGGKLDTKIKAGDIKESELMKEATDLMKKMKGMPGMSGMSDMNKMFQSMGMSMPPNMGKNTKINMAAMNNMMRKQEKIDQVRANAKVHMEKRREEQRLKEEMEKRRKEYVAPTNEEIDKLISDLALDAPSVEPKLGGGTTGGAKKKKKKKNKK